MSMSTKTMQNQPTDDLEQALREMTVWRGAEPRLWESALARNEQSPIRLSDRVMRVLHWNMPKALAASILLLIGVAIVLAVGLERTRNGRATSTGKQLASAMTAYGSEWNDRSIARANDNFSAYSSGQDGGGMGGAPASAITARASAESWPQVATAPQRDYYIEQTQPTPHPDRLVVRKATIELESADVRRVFLKVAHLASEASGEFVEQSSLTGEGETAQASLTLRIAVDRLDRVMNDLRELAQVRSENLTGEDVTAQVVDLEARLRNEQRVETEILELLQKRADAPLEDILHLREEISRVRQRIEQIAAQQQRLSRLVSLASVLVIIRAQPPTVEDQKEDEASLREYFDDAITDSWSAGMRFLADTLAGLMGVLIGGAVWWIALLAALLALRQHLRRRAGLA